jgi:hypothetical protein
MKLIKPNSLYEKWGKVRVLEGRSKLGGRFSGCAVSGRLIYALKVVSPV